MAWQPAAETTKYSAHGKYRQGQKLTAVSGGKIFFNWMKNKFLTSFIILLFAAIVAKYLINLYYCAQICNGWVIGDWLINFSAGFVRRGLGGYLIIHLANLIGLKPSFCTMLIQAVFCLTYMSTLLFLIYRKEITAWFLLILLSPATLLFPINEKLASGRKEVILFTLFALYVLCLNKKLLKSNFMVFLFSLALLVATMFHELMVFYTPYFLLAAYLQSKIDREPFCVSRPLFVISGSFLMLLPLYLFGKTINEPAISDGLIQQGMAQNITNGVLSWGSSISVGFTINCAKEYEYISTYGSILFLSLLPFVFFVKYLKHPLVDVKKFLAAFLFLFTFSAPLFAITIDWGRWINIHFILLLIASTLLLKDKCSNVQDDWPERYLDIPSLQKRSVLFRCLGSLVLLVLCVGYVTLWYIPICCQARFCTLKVYHCIYEIFCRLV